MKLPKSTKAIALSGLIGLGALGTIQKTKDYYNYSNYENLKTHYTKGEEAPLLKTHTDLISNKLSDAINDQPLSERQRQEDIKSATEDYKDHSFPLLNYETDPKLYQQLIQDRISHNLYPGNVFPTGLEEYDSDVRRKHGNALCSSAIWMKLSKMNNLSSSMQEFFAQQGKHTRFAEQLLSQYGWESTIDTKDQLSYYKQTTKNHLHPHYHHLLQNLHNAQAGDIMLMRYSRSGAHGPAREANKNATHNILSRGTQTQTFIGSEIGILHGSQKYKDFFKLDNREKTIELIYLLMSRETHTKEGYFSRAASKSMVGEEKIQKARISKFLKDYPDLLHVERQPTQDKKDIQITYTGVMGEHVYPVNGEPTNFANFIFELLAYTGTNADGSTLLLCDHMTARINIKKNLQKYSGAYTHIEKIRKTISNKDMILKTYIVSFDMIDLNNNKKIDRGDKTIDEILDDMTEISYNNTYTINHLSKEDTKEYIRKYLHIIGAMDRFPTGTLLYIPYLTEENRKIIDELYIQYEQYYFQRQHESQEFYNNHISESLKTQKFDDIPYHGIILYPTISGDDEISITRQIGKYIDDIVEQNPHIGNKNISMSNLSREELQMIFSLIQSEIQLPKNMHAGKKAIINLGNILKILDQSYYPTKVQLSQNHLPEVSKNSDHMFDELDKVYEILNISPSVQNIQKHIMLRETSGDMSIWDIAKGRSWSKMIGEALDFDDNNPLASIKNINSEGPLQMRIDYFLGANNNIDLLIQSCKQIVEKKRELKLHESDISRLEDLIEQSLLLKSYNDPKTKDKFREQQTQVKHNLSDIINLTKESLENPAQELGTLLSIVLTSYSSEKYMRRYSAMIQSSMGTNQLLSSDEVSFIQHFVTIAHHLGQQDADHAFKIYMTIHMMRAMKETNLISTEDYELVKQLGTKLNNIRKMDKGDLFGKEYNPNWYTDRYKIVKDNFGENDNASIRQMLSYLDPNSLDQNIPHYGDIRDKQIGETNGMINNNIFEIQAVKEFSLYLTTLPPRRDGTSALIRLLTTLLGSALGIYKFKKAHKGSTNK